MTPLRQAPPTGRRYPVPVMVRARQLREAGWSRGEIADRVEQEFGTRPSVETVSIWTNPRRAKSHARSTSASHRRRRNARLTGRMPNALRHGKDFQEIRARALADSGVLYSQVAKIMAFDYPEAGWTEHRVRKLLGPKRPLEAAA